MHRQRVSPFLTGLITSVVLLAVITVIFIGGIPAGPHISLPWNQTMTLRVQLVNADALAPHASVEIAGVKVGEVESVNADGNVAVATLQVAEQYSAIHNDAVVYLRAHGLFGPKYIAIVPGTAAAPTLHDGDMITLTHTVQPVDLDALLQDLQTPEQQDLRTLFVQLGLAAAGRGNDVNHLLAAADSLTQVLDSPVRAVGAVAPQLSDMLTQDEAFNAYFAQTPLDQLVANSEQTFQAVAANAAHLDSLLVHANSSLTQLNAALGGEPSNLATIIQDLGQPGGTIDKLEKFTYLLSLFGANLTGKEASLGTDPAALDDTNGIISAITSVASAFYYSDPCPTLAIKPGTANTNHCVVSPDGRRHYLDTRLGNFPPSTNPNPSVIISDPLPQPGQLIPDSGLTGFAGFLAS